MAGVATPAGFNEAAMEAALPFPLSNAGKSSDFKAGCDACEAMALESPVLEASALTSCFACKVEDSVAEGVVFCTGGDTTGTGARAIEVLDCNFRGVKGAEVGIIRDTGF